MGALSSREDSKVSSMLSTFTGPDAVGPEDKFWHQFLSINFQQYARKSSYASCTLDEQELKLRRNHGNSRNLRTFIELIRGKIGEAATIDSLKEATNGLFILRSFLYRQLAAPNETFARLLYDPESPDILTPWQQHLLANGYDVLLQSIIHAMLYFKVVRKEIYNFQAESATTLLSAFLVPQWQRDMRESLFAYSCFLGVSPDTAANVMKMFIDYFIRDTIGLASDEIEDSPVVSWIDFMESHIHNDKLGDTCLWLLLLLAHRPEKDNDVYNKALSSFVDEASINYNCEDLALEIEPAAENFKKVNEAFIMGNLPRKNGSDTDSEKNLVDDSQVLFHPNINCEYNQFGVGNVVGESKHPIACNENEKDKSYGMGRRCGSLPSKLDLESFLELQENNVSASEKLLDFVTERNSSHSDAEKMELIKINFNDLFTAISYSIDKDGTIMLVYTLILRNKRVKKYFQISDDVNHLIYALTKKLYGIENLLNSYVTYLCLCIILMLSEDSYFCDRLHDLPSDDVSWFRERILSKVSLGSLLVIVLCRLLNINISKSRDEFISENVLAIMSNMASTFKNLHPFACQQLVTTFEVLGRRFLRLYPSDKGDPAINETSQGDKDNYLAILKEIMLALLQIMDACVVVHLPENPNFVYTLLHKAPMFKRFVEIDDFQCSLTNLALVWKFYTDRLSKKEGQLSEEDIFEEIQTCEDPFPYHLLRPVEDMKYQYIEDKNCPGFFLPFVSHIISHDTKLLFNHDMLPG